MVWLAIIISCFFAINIGASGAAAAIGIAYGSGAIKKARVALIICAIAIFLGATIGGGEVIKTIGKGIISTDLLSIKIVVIILLSSTLSLFLANLLGIPLSTSEVTVGAVVGVGVSLQSLYVLQLLQIILFWFIVPLIAFTFAYLFKKFFKKYERRKSHWEKSRWIMWLLVIAGFIEAFSAGMNNVANAVGPIVGAGYWSIEEGKWIGGIFVAVGVLLLGWRVLETNGKKIVSLSKIDGLMISSTGGALVIVCSIVGVPIPMTQVTTSSILGVGLAKDGTTVFKKKIVHQILRVWLVSPFFSFLLSLLLVQAWVFSNSLMWAILLAVAVASIYRLFPSKQKKVYQAK